MENKIIFSSTEWEKKNVASHIKKGAKSNKNSKLPHEI